MSEDEAALVAMMARSGGEWLVAECGGDAVELLRARDHHVVTVDGRRGLLLTYHLWAEAGAARVYVLFAHVAGHPAAPAAVQDAVGRLSFRRG